MKTATERTNALRDRLARAGIDATYEQANVLRRAEITLHRWGEQECGDGNDYCSWSIERDETTGKPYKAIYPHNGKPRRYPIPDRERGALRRVAAACKALSIYYHHQTDPRGVSLYVSREPLTDCNYPRGVACGE